jgi:hypothetical protein
VSTPPPTHPGAQLQVYWFRPLVHVEVAPPQVTAAHSSTSTQTASVPPPVQPAAQLQVYCGRLQQGRG